MLRLRCCYSYASQGHIVNICKDIYMVLIKRLNEVRDLNDNDSKYTLYSL